MPPRRLVTTRNRDFPVKTPNTVTYSKLMQIHFVSKAILHSILVLAAVRLAVADDDKAANAPHVRSYDLDDPSEPWRTAKSGVTTKVLRPYTPLALREQVVGCWGREYAVDGLFPTAIRSQGQELLVRPIELRIKRDGVWSALKPRASQIHLVRDDRIESSASATPVESSKVSTSSSIEYDGFLRTDVTLAAAQDSVVEGLRLVFAFAPSAAIFHHLEMRWTEHIYKASPKQPGESLVYSWKPLVWIGNHDVGLTIVSETWDGWTSAQDAIRLERSEKELTLTFDIITKPTEITQPIVYEFGLLATPTKPMPKDRWNVRVGSLPSSNLTAINFGGNAQPLFSFPQPRDFGKLAQSLQRSHDRGLRTCCYITTSATSAQSQVSQRNRVDWLMSKVVLEGGEWKTGKGFIGVDACCPASTFADFMAWSVDQVMSHTDFAGIYIDNPGPYWCENHKHGCGKGGKRTFPFFALRDLHKRIYTIVKSRRADGIVWEHTSETFNPLQLAWVDVYSDGEHFRDAKNYPKERLLQVFDRTFMEITGTGVQAGATPAFLSSMGVRKDGDWSHWLLARTLPFGQMVCNYHGWLDGTPAIAACRARMEFGVGEEAIDYFRPHELPSWFSVRPTNVVAGLWQRRRDGAALTVLANWSEAPVTARLGGGVHGQFGAVEITDAMTGAVFPRAHEFLIFSIPANSFRMILLESKTAVSK